MSKRKNADYDRRNDDAGICETFGRLDALYHQATGKRLERNGSSLETVEWLLRTYGMCETEEIWAWWMREPEYGRECPDPLSYFTDDSVLDDIRILAFTEEARLRLAERSQRLREAAGEAGGAV